MVILIIQGCNGFSKFVSRVYPYFAQITHGRVMTNLSIVFRTVRDVLGIIPLYGMSSNLSKMSFRSLYSQLTQSAQNVAHQPIGWFLSHIYKSTFIDKSESRIQARAIIHSFVENIHVIYFQLYKKFHPHISVWQFYQINVRYRRMNRKNTVNIRSVPSRVSTISTYVVEDIRPVFTVRSYIRDCLELIFGYSVVDKTSCIRRRTRDRYNIRLSHL